MKLIASRTAQYPLVSGFIFSFNNYVQDFVDLALKTLGALPP